MWWALDGQATFIYKNKYIYHGGYVKNGQFFAIFGLGSGDISGRSMAKYAYEWCGEVAKVVVTWSDGPGMSRLRSYVKIKKMANVGVQHSGEKALLGG